MPPQPADPGSRASDEVRERLIDAAAAVFAREGYAGTRIHDIVREAGLTTGAVYGRFRGKSELLHEAVIARATPQVRIPAERIAKVADLIALGASRTDPGLSDREALLLETYVAARRDPEVARALADADSLWREAVAPLVDAALADGTVAPDVDPDAVLYLVRVLRVGMLLQRGSGLPGPDPEGWGALMARVVASFGVHDQAAPTRDADPALSVAHPPPPAASPTPTTTHTEGTTE
jgi:AcrR family transcriptional regulator